MPSRRATGRRIAETNLFLAPTGSMAASTIVIFGASGDLTSRKLIPALFRLDAVGQLPEDTHVVGVARRPYTDDEFRKLIEPKVDRSVMKVESFAAIALILFFIHSSATQCKYSQWL